MRGACVRVEFLCVGCASVARSVGRWLDGSTVGQWPRLRTHAGAAASSRRVRRGLCLPALFFMPGVRVLCRGTDTDTSVVNPTRCCHIQDTIQKSREKIFFLGKIFYFFQDNS